MSKRKYTKKVPYGFSPIFASPDAKKVTDGAESKKAAKDVLPRFDAELNAKITQLIRKDIFTRDDQRHIDAFVADSKLSPITLKLYFDAQKHKTDAWYYVAIRYLRDLTAPLTLHRYIVQLAGTIPTDANAPTYNILSRNYVNPKPEDLIDFIGTLKNIVETRFNDVDVSGYVEILIEHKQITDVELTELVKKNVIYAVSMPPNIQTAAVELIKTAPIQYVKFTKRRNARRELLEVLLRRCPMLIRHISIDSLDMELVETAILYGDPWELFHGCSYELEQMLDEMAELPRYKSEKFVNYYVNRMKKYTNVITEDEFEVYGFTPAYALHGDRSVLGMFLNYPHTFCAKGARFDKKIFKMLKKHPDKWKVAQALVFIYCNSDRKQQIATMFYCIFKYSILRHPYRQYDVYDTTYFATDKYAQFHPEICRQALQRSEANLEHIRCRDDSLYLQYLEKFLKENREAQMEKFQHLPLEMAKIVAKNSGFDLTKQNSIELLVNDPDFMFDLPNNVLSYEDCVKFIQLAPQHAEILFNTHRPIFDRLAKEGKLRSGDLHFLRNNKKSNDVCMKACGYINTRNVTDVNTWGISPFYALKSNEVGDFMYWVSINIDHIFFGENGVSIK